jgi:voltage-gated potassium channel
MFRRLTLFFEFVHTFVQYILHIREVVATLILSIVLGGFAFSLLEGVKLGSAVYFAFITALSVGYGDISPQTAMGRVVSICLGITGILFVGITAACATRALADTAKRDTHSRS